MREHAIRQVRQRKILRGSFAEAIQLFRFVRSGHPSASRSLNGFVKRTRTEAREELSHLAKLFGIPPETVNADRFSRHVKCVRILLFENPLPHPSVACPK